MTILLTGGSGFIGTNFINNWMRNEEEHIVNLDMLTYAANRHETEQRDKCERYTFIETNIANTQKVSQILSKYKPRAVINFAAETHVDASISTPDKFIKKNILSSYEFLKTVTGYWNHSTPIEQQKFVFMQVSTDEVYGSLETWEPPFSETSNIKPNSPYSASKASFDHILSAWHSTYGLPVVISRCSNNFGPFQNREKFIPKIIYNSVNEKKIPIYGDGSQIRDWLFVEDHCNALCCLLENGKPGEIYNVGGNQELQNIDLVNLICDYLDRVMPSKKIVSYRDLIEFVSDRPGHDLRYAIDNTKISGLGWSSKRPFKKSLEKTIEWYLKNNLINC
ncbi:dTDP-glucose 4,6-dehydratase [Alphaproteobacteria bacterium]|nr:dTDP-glucose 4,6-dehydratase [Alphaproteobacteria bacterium]